MHGVVGNFGTHLRLDEVGDHARWIHALQLADVIAALDRHELPVGEDHVGHHVAGDFCLECFHLCLVARARVEHKLGAFLLIWHPVQVGDQAAIGDDEGHTHLEGEHLTALIISKWCKCHSIVDFGGDVKGVVHYPLDVSIRNALEPPPDQSHSTVIFLDSLLSASSIKDGRVRVKVGKKFVCFR